MKANAAVALLAVLSCLPAAAGQTKDDPCAKNSKSDREVQECRAISQIAPQIQSAVQTGSIGTVASAPAGIAAGLSYNVHMSDCEDRWVALYHKPEDRDYTYGFVYIDPEAGFTLHYAGRFTVDSDRNYHEAPNPLPPDQLSLKIRLEQNGIAALLPPRALAQLALTEKPDWLKFYEDKADPVTHKISWGFFYNAIGDSQRAIDYLEPAYSEKPDAPRVVFELTYAYNAVGRAEDAIRVSKSGLVRNPKDELLCRETAFAYLHLKSYKAATEQYQTCIALCDDSDKSMAEKSELAVNLSSAYERLGDAQSRDAWKKKAQDWAPKGSPVYKYFHPDEQ
jgi:tetratricopeptide (TPR) repeat protein